MEAYFDNAATTRCCPEAVEVMRRVFLEDYGNPSSMHQKGVDAERHLRKARQILASTLKAQEKEILFTSGGTESDNLAIFGAAQAGQRLGKHLVTTMVEHPAVLEPFRRLEKEGFEVSYLPVGQDGILDLETLEKALRPDTILVSIMAVNNEVGSQMPLEAAARLIHEKGKALFHVDGVQAYTRIPLYPGRLGIDLFSASSHKFHGPKGTGFLYIRDGVHLVPQMLGGGQQKGLRSGTEAVPLLVGMAAAASVCISNREAESALLYKLKSQLVEGVLPLGGISVNGPALAQAAPHIVNLSFAGIRSEVLLHALEDRGIYVSAGSACSSHKRKDSGTLSAMGLETGRRESALRFSFSGENTPQEIEMAIAALQELVPQLRRFSRR